MVTIARSLRTPSLLSAVVLFVACQGTGPTLVHVSLSATSGASPVATAGLSADIHIGSGANSLTISKAQIVLSRIKLSPSGGATCSETTEDKDDCDELEAGPALVDLPVDGTTKVVLDALVPAGTYDGLSAKIDAVHADEDEPGVNAFLTAHPDWKGVSVKVTGVFTDASKTDHSFTFSSEVDAHVHARFQPPVKVDNTTSNLTINANVASWFTGATGAAIDPTNAANQETIERNIENSFRAFRDDDRDGKDDDAAEHHS
jgi:hypothetical protein